MYILNNNKNREATAKEILFIKFYVQFITGKFDIFNTKRFYNLFDSTLLSNHRFLMYKDPTFDLKYIEQHFFMTNSMNEIYANTKAIEVSTLTEFLHLIYNDYRDFRKIK